MGAVFAVVLVMVGVAAALALYRLLRGPSTLDRVVALDVVVVLTLVAAGVYVAYYRDGSNIPLLAAVALVGFVGSTARRGWPCGGSGTGERACERTNVTAPARGADRAQRGSAVSERRERTAEGER